MMKRAAAAVLLLTACAGQLRDRVAELEVAIADARSSGARNCAPVELAMAEAHGEFAVIEIDQGDYYRARAELAVAETNAAQALQRSPRQRCAVSEAGADLDRDGVPDDRDECQRQPEDRDGADDHDGCPESDNDGDGFVDESDRCPMQPEDRDGHDDEDGCPDGDNDGDKLGDRVDQCPDTPEDADGHDDDDGCPDCDDDGDKVPECPLALDRCPGQSGRPGDGCPYANVALTERGLQLTRPIRFKKGRKVVLAPAARALLDDVAKVLADRPELKIRIEAHTDSKGRDKANLRRSKAQAAAVRGYLVGRGIDGSRIVSVGYGEKRPIAENRTAAGRAQNQRVEFVITGR
jgi:OOP family OmpA-OmpF porin